MQTDTNMNISRRHFLGAMGGAGAAAMVGPQTAVGQTDKVTETEQAVPLPQGPGFGLVTKQDVGDFAAATTEMLDFIVDQEAGIASYQPFTIVNPQGGSKHLSDVGHDLLEQVQDTRLLNDAAGLMAQLSDSRFHQSTSAQLFIANHGTMDYDLFESIFRVTGDSNKPRSPEPILSKSIIDHTNKFMQASERFHGLSMNVPADSVDSQLRSDFFDAVQEASDKIGDIGAVSRKPEDGEDNDVAKNNIRNLYESLFAEQPNAQAIRDDIDRLQTFANNPRETVLAEPPKRRSESKKPSKKLANDGRNPAVSAMHSDGEQNSSAHIRNRISSYRANHGSRL